MCVTFKQRMNPEELQTDSELLEQQLEDWLAFESAHLEAQILQAAESV